MPLLSPEIASALTPGVALTSCILHHSSLHQRYQGTSARIRGLNGEARELALRLPPEIGRIRLRSIRIQVELFLRRALLIRRSILVSYVALIAFMVTIAELLAFDYYDVSTGRVIANVTFAIAIACFAISILISASEVYVTKDTLVEDIRTSLPREDGRRTESHLDHPARGTPRRHPH